jgi:hypothetical protein
VFGDGVVEEGIFEDGDLIDGRRWVLNDDGSYQFYQVTHGVDKLVGQVAKLPGPKI